MAVRARVLVPIALVLASSVAAAQPLDYVLVDPPRTRAAGGTKTVYLNRCAAGCTATAGDDDASTNRSSILGREGAPATVSLAPFMWSQATWDGVVTCVRERFAPFQITVVTDEPTAGRYLEMMVAGSPSALAMAPNTLGVAPLTNNCSALPSAIGFAFANVHPERDEQIEELCTTVIHEAGHLYGLDHEFECRDPMTYLGDCGAKVFLNTSARCGENAARDCQCGATQNSFLKLLRTVGPGTPPAGATLRMDYPAADAVVTSRFSVFAVVESPRPVREVALWINGRAWVRVPGEDQDHLYQLDTPADVPDGVLDLELRARDDLGNVGVLARRVVKGAACVDGMSCPADQTCVDGGCRTAAGTGAVGDACATDGDCASKLCVRDDESGVCTAWCYPEVIGCDDGFACRGADDEGLGCLVPVDEGGCCSTGGRPDGAAVLVAAVAAMLTARRRRRAS